MIVLLSALAGGTLPAGAFDTEYFPRNTVLSQGRWVKVAVSEDGLYRIPASTLRAWGFTDPSRVRMFGTGGQRMADALTTGNVPADLPLLQSAVTADGSVVFYAHGPGTLNKNNSLYYYEPNVYSSRAFYFVTESDTAAREIPVTPATDISSGASTSFMQILHHEKELISPGEAGPLLLGEDFRYTRSHSFDFTFPAAAVPNGKISARVSFVSKITEGTASVTIELPGTDCKGGSNRLTNSSKSQYTHGTENVFSTSGYLTSDNATSQSVKLSLQSPATPLLAALNSITLMYERPLTLPASGYLTGEISGGSVLLNAVSEANASGLIVWDVTKPADITAVETMVSGTSVQWSTPYSAGTTRRFAVWTPTASIPAPEYVENVANQNLHGASSPDMVILAPQAFMAQAQRIADYHAASSDSLKVMVVDVDEVYNEFSGGHADPAGIRNYLKMLYDRGNDGDGRPLRYLLIMARMTVDNRHLLREYGSHPTIPGWSPWSLRSSLSDNEGYFTDDFYAMLDDNGGANMRVDKLRIAVGRIPVVDVNEAKAVVDKELEYARGARHTAWKQRMMFLADDGDRSVHLKQTEAMVNGFCNANAIPYVSRKIYLDAYTRQGGVYPEARSAMFRNLDEGVVWWNFIGHASTVGWTADGQLSYSDLNKLYLRHLPFIYASTCDFLRLDGVNISGAEVLYKERYGGCIGVISATRPVYIADNGPLSAAIGRALGKRDAAGRIFTPGEMYRQGKNDIRDADNKPVADDNRLRYVFVGDPALRLAVPDNIVAIDSINGVAIDAENPPTIAALSRASISGRILSPDGSLRSGFNGTVIMDIFDSEYTITTTPEDDTEPENFEEMGNRVFTGSAEVRDGRFRLTAAIPAELAQNYRPAAIGAFAYASTENDEAAGLFRDFYLYGYDESAPADSEAPVIESIVLNHSTFRNGDTVNPSPMLIAQITDNVGINISSAGIGHQMTATLDGTRTFNDLSFYYTPYPDGTPGGVINYPFDEITDGNHTLQLRVWDTSGNSARAQLDFFVAQGVAPKIYDIYSDANPASAGANFYLSHDQPDAIVDVTVTVYNLLGRPVWSGSASGRSDMFLSVPVSWDLTDFGGRRVPRGIYLYRATITGNGNSYETATRRLAVTAR